MEVQDVLVLFGFSAFLLVPKRTLTQAQASSTPSPKQVYPVFPRNIRGSVPGCTALLSLNPRITLSVVGELYPAPGANSSKPRSTGLFIYSFEQQAVTVAITFCESETYSGSYRFNLSNL